MFLQLVLPCSAVPSLVTPQELWKGPSIPLHLSPGFSRCWCRLWPFSLDIPGEMSAENTNPTFHLADDSRLYLSSPDLPPPAHAAAQPLADISARTRSRQPRRSDTTPELSPSVPSQPCPRPHRPPGQVNVTSELDPARQAQPRALPAPGRSLFAGSIPKTRCPQGCPERGDLSWLWSP